MLMLLQITNKSVFYPAQESSTSSVKRHSETHIIKSTVMKEVLEEPKGSVAI